MQLNILIILLLSSVCIRSEITFPEHSCGKSKVGKQTVVGGNEIERGAYPWNVALVRVNGDLICGGTLISNKTIITAAHCIKRKFGEANIGISDMLAVLGVHELKNPEHSKIYIAIKSVSIHSDWNPHTASFDADIALLELANEVHFNQFIQPICLPEPDSPESKIIEGIAAGFGKSEDADVQNVQRVTKIPIISYSDCIKSIEHEYIMSHRTFCGGYANGTGVCIGDSGSGLIVSYNGHFYLRGIISASLFGAKYGCDLDTRSVFTDVVKFTSWINSGGINECENSISKLQIENERILKELNEEKEKNGQLEENNRKLKEQLKIKMDQLKKYKDERQSEKLKTDEDLTSKFDSQKLQISSQIQIQNETEKLKEEIELQAQELSILSKENEKLKSKLNSTKDQLRKVRNECQEEKEQFEVLQNECNLSVQNITFDLNQTKDNLQSISQQHDHESKQLLIVTEENEKLKEENEQQSKNFIKLEGEKNELKMQLLLAKQNLSEILEENQKLSTNLAEEKRKLMLTSQNNDNLSSQIASNQGELRMSRNRISSFNPNFHIGYTPPTRTFYVPRAPHHHHQHHHQHHSHNGGHHRQGWRL